MQQSQHVIENTIELEILQFIFFFFLATEALVIGKEERLLFHILYHKWQDFLNVALKSLVGAMGIVAMLSKLGSSQKFSFHAFQITDDTKTF